MEKTKLEIKFNNNAQEPIKFDAQLMQINFTFISNLLWQLRKIRKNQIEFIKYLNEENAWESIKVTNNDINVANKTELKILVKLIKKEKPDQNIEQMINRVKNISSSIDNEIAELKNLQYIKNNSGDLLSLKSAMSNSSFNISDFSKEPSFALQDEENADVIILTANPLCYRYEKDKIKELRIMNEFNCITEQIYHVLSKTNLPIKSQFSTLTKNNFINAINKKPKILHLICKSTYECDNYNQNSSKLIQHLSSELCNEINENKIEENKIEENEIEENEIKKTYSPILIFENEKCQMEKITYNILSKIFKSKGDLTKDITLFISTPLSKDVFDMFLSLSQIEFKNILVQHSTLADASYIAQFNRDLYLNLLDKKSLDDSLDQAKRINFSGYQFCCCSHEHDDDKCLIKKYLSNELFIEDEEDSNEIKDENNHQVNQEFIQKIPHLYHLRYKCICKEIIQENSPNYNNFCYHNVATCENKSFILFNGKKSNICCCQKKNKKIQHNLEGIFQIKKTNKEIIFNDYNNEKYKKCVIINKEYVPNYGKMQFKVRFNKILYRIFEFISKKNCNILNVYGNQYNSLEIGNFINIIEEYVKERHSYFLWENPKNNNNIISNKESEDLSLHKKDTTNIKTLNKLDSIDLAMHNQNSAMELHMDFNNFIKPMLNIIVIDNINNLASIYSKKSDNNNKIYIINALKFNDWNSYEWIKKLRTKIDVSKIYLIIFDTNKINENIEEDNHIEKIDYISFDPLDKYDWMVKNQIYKIENNKDDFENLSKEKGRNLTNEDKNEIMDYIKENNVDSEMFYLVLYLFNCANSGLFAFEFEDLFPDELEEAKKIRDIYVDKKILNIETNRNNNGSINKKHQVYTKYIKNKNFIRDLCALIKIPENTKHNILRRLFLFYAKKYRLLIRKVKKDRNRINLQKQEINVKGYKPTDSLFSFSAIQSLGIWLPLNDASAKFEDHSTAPIYNIEGYFNHLNRNFKDIFLIDNFELCHINKDIWNDVKESIEDISITLLTLYKIYDKKEIEYAIPKFNTLFEKFHFSKAAMLRLKLFVKMQNDFYNTDKNNKENTLKFLQITENAFSEINNKEGQLETLYAQYINIDINENDILVKIKKILKEMKKEKIKEKFAILFEAKIKYKLLKHKIIKKRLYTEELENLFKECIETFHKNNEEFYVIKTLLLKSYYYMNKKEDKINEDAFKFEFLYYLNSAYIYTENDIYIDYIKKIAHKKYKKYKLEESLGKNNIKYNAFRKELIKIFDKYNLGNPYERSLFNYVE